MAKKKAKKKVAKAPTKKKAAPRVAAPRRKKKAAAAPAAAAAKKKVAAVPAREITLHTRCTIEEMKKKYGKDIFR